MNLNTILVFITSTASILLSIIVYLNGKNKLSNITLALFSLAIAVWTFGQGMGSIFPDKDIVIFWTRVNIGAAVFLPSLYLHFVLSVINKTKNQRVMLFAVYVFAFVFIALLFTPLFIKDIVPMQDFNYYPKGGIVYPYFAFYLISVFLYGLAQLIIALIKEKGREREKYSYIVLASIIGFSGGVTAFFPIFGINFPVISHFTLPIYAAITAYAIIKHKLLDIEIVIREGLLYSGLTVLFAGFYALLILLANNIFQKVMHLNGYLVTIIVVFVSVIIFQPVKDWLQKIIDRMFYKGSYFYEKRIRDLASENKKLFQSLLRADKLAALGTMAAGMAHEIKNPLASIKAMTQILPENLVNKSFIDDYSDMIPRQLDRINAIVENLLKTGAPKRPERKPVDINKILSDAVLLHKKTCEKQGINIIKKLSVLPKIHLDPEQIYQVFINIIINAIDAMPNGGTLTITTEKKASGALISISDTGIGIENDNINNIFDPFFSLKEKGTGLGLFIAYRVIQEHDGTIEVESEKGKGTKFNIWLSTKQKG